MTQSTKAPIAPFEPGTYDGIPHWATRTPGIPMRARMVLVVLISYDRPDKDNCRKGCVTPSLRTLAAVLGTNHGHIREEIAVLESLGCVTVERWAHGNRRGFGSTTAGRSLVPMRYQQWHPYWYRIRNPLVPNQRPTGTNGVPALVPTWVP